jgi:hypothetical protein
MTLQRHRKLAENPPPGTPPLAPSRLSATPRFGPSDGARTAIKAGGHVRATALSLDYHRICEIFFEKHPKCLD